MQTLHYSTYHEFLVFNINRDVFLFPFTASVSKLLTSFLNIPVQNIHKYLWHFWSHFNILQCPQSQSVKIWSSGFDKFWNFLLCKKILLNLRNFHFNISPLLNCLIHISVNFHPENLNHNKFLLIYNHSSINYVVSQFLNSIVSHIAAFIYFIYFSS